MVTEEKNEKNWAGNGELKIERIEIVIIDGPLIDFIFEISNKPRSHGQFEITSS
jgi:hypothetical protein